MSNQNVPPLSPEEAARVVDVWKYVVSVQMHFNDMEMKVRNLYFTILAAALALVGVVQGKVVPLFGASVHLSLFVIVAIIPISMLFYFIDRHWYHRLLQGAVAQAIKIESKYATSLPEIQLGVEISKASPVHFSWLWKWVFIFIRDRRFRDKGNLHSDQKIELLYKSVIFGCLLTMVLFGAFHGVQIKDCPIAFYLSNGPCVGGTVPDKPQSVTVRMDGPIKLLVPQITIGQINRTPLSESTATGRKK